MRDRLALAVAGALVAAHVAILLGSRLQPFVDIPNHLAVATIARDHGEPTNRFADHYSLGSPFAPNQAHWRFCSAPVFPSVEAANRIYHAGYVVLLVASTATLVRAVGGDPWAAPLALLYAYNFDVHWGFANFVAGIPAILLFCRLLIADLEAPSSARRLGIAFALLALFFFHVLVALFGILVFVLVLVSTARGPWTTILGRILLAAPCLAALALWWASGGHGDGTAAFLASYYREEWLPTLAGRAQLLANDNLHVQGVALGLALALLAPISLAWFAVAAGGVRRFLRPPFGAASHRVVGMLAAAALGCALLLPDRLPDQRFLWERFSVFFFLALVVAGSRAAMPRPWIRPAVVVALCCLHLVVHADHFARFQFETRDFVPELFPSGADGATLAGMDYDCRYRGDPTYAHFPSYFVVWKRGIAATSVVDYRFGWIRREGAADLPPHVPWLDDAHDRFGHARLDYLLTCGEIPADSRQLFSSFRPLRTSGRWTLHRRNDA